MIYTITLNPSLDKTIEVEELIYDDVNQVVEEKQHPSGKGIDISRVIKELGGESIALGFIGGYTGLELEGRLINEGIVCDFTRINSETKSNLIIYQRKKKLNTLLSTPDPEITPIELSIFFNKIKQIPSGSYVVISSSNPACINENFYAQLITTLKEKGVRVILDADEKILKKGVSSGPYLIKPNIHELGRLVEKNINEVEEVIGYAKPLQDNVDYIIVSMGARGLIGITDNRVYLVTPPKVKVRNSMGAGNSLIAGTVFALNNGDRFEDAIILGAACGTASTLNNINNLCTKEDVEAIKKVVTIKKI